MSQAHRAAEDWNQHYLEGHLPWDSGEVDPDLSEAMDRLELGAGQSLEIGCGTGTNAIAMARRGLSVTAIDIAPRAVEMASVKAQAAGVDHLVIRTHDILVALPPGVDAGAMDFVFDRGVFHAMAREQSPLFAQRVAEALEPGAWWLSLCGNADDTTPGGPPRLTAAHIAAGVEPRFEVHELMRSRFRKVREAGADVYISWRVLLRKRGTAVR